jgi:F-type H+-transporting ATPase subunit b
MHIDWFVLFAQLVNFLILVYLLKRFLYTRIIQAMNEREAKMVARFEEAAKLKKEAEETIRAYEEKNSSLQVQAERMLNQARDAADRRQRELMSQARFEVDEIRRRWSENVLKEKAAFLEGLRLRAGKQVYAIARKILSDLADATIEHRMVEVLISRIDALSQKEKEAIKSSLEDSGEEVIVQSAFPLAPEDRQRMAATVQRLTGSPDRGIQYRENLDLIGGIELLAHGHRIAWNISDYLDSLEANFDRALREEVRQNHPESPHSEEQKPCTAIPLTIMI